MSSGGTPAVFDVCVLSTHTIGATLEVGVIWQEGGPMVIDRVLLVYENCVPTLQSPDGSAITQWSLDCSP